LTGTSNELDIGAPFNGAASRSTRRILDVELASLVVCELVYRHRTPTESVAHSFEYGGAEFD
jgi:hypothetical protein